MHIKSNIFYEFFYIFTIHYCSFRQTALITGSFFCHICSVPSSGSSSAFT